MLLARGLPLSHISVCWTVASTRGHRHWRDRPAGRELDSLAKPTLQKVLVSAALQRYTTHTRGVLTSAPTEGPSVLTRPPRRLPSYPGAAHQLQTQLFLLFKAVIFLTFLFFSLIKEVSNLSLSLLVIFGNTK